MRIGKFIEELQVEPHALMNEIANDSSVAPPVEAPTTRQEASPREPCPAATGST